MLARYVSVDRVRLICVTVGSRVPMLSIVLGRYQTMEERRMYSLSAPYSLRAAFGFCEPDSARKPPPSDGPLAPYDV